MTQNNMIPKTVRLSRATVHTLKEYSEETGMPMASLLRDAIYSYMDRNDDLHVSDTLQKVINRRTEYVKAEEEKLYMKMENKRISNTIKQNTFKAFMDNFMAQIYLSNHEYMSKDDLEELLKESLQTLEHRAEHHDELSAYRNRLENPVEYTEEYLDRKSKHNETFSDKFLSDMN